MAKGLYTLPVALIALTAYGSPAISSGVDEISDSKFTNLFASEQIDTENSSQNAVEEKSPKFETLYITENENGGIGQISTNKAELTKPVAVTLSIVPPQNYEDSIYLAPQVMAQPEFLGKNANVNDFRMWIGNQLKSDGKSEGRVIARFVIEKDGTVSTVEIVRSLNKEIDAQVVEAIKKSGKWSKATNDGKPIRCAYMFPVDFKSAAPATDEVIVVGKDTKGNVNVFQKAPNNSYIKALMKENFGDNSDATLVVVINSRSTKMEIDGKEHDATTVDQLSKKGVEGITAADVEEITVDKERAILKLVLNW